MARDSHRCDGADVKGRDGETGNREGGEDPVIEKEDQYTRRKTEDKQSQEVAGAWEQMNEISDASRSVTGSKPTENNGSNKGEPHSGIG